VADGHGVLLGLVGLGSNALILVGVFVLERRVERPAVPGLTTL